MLIIISLWGFFVITKSAVQKRRYCAYPRRKIKEKVNSLRAKPEARHYA